MIRNVLAVIVGLTIGMVINMAIIMINTAVLHPVPEGLDMYDNAQMNAYIATLPWHAFLIVIAAHISQSFTGAWVAARLAASKPMLLAMIIGALSLAGGIANMAQLDHPAFMYIELPLYLAAAWWAGRMEVQRRAAAS